MNIVDRTFEEVLRNIGSNGLEDLPDTGESDDQDTDIIDNPPPDNENTTIDTLRDDREIRDATGQLLGSPAGREFSIPLGEEKEKLIEGGIRGKGLDCLAFYKSRRFRDRNPLKGYWGIFYLSDGLDYLAEKISKQYPGYRNIRDLTIKLLYNHEYFHYKADIQTLMFEAVLNRNLYINRRNIFKHQRSLFVEEALANNAVYTWSKQPRVGISDFVYDFCKLQPNAYARFDEKLPNLRGEWMSNTLDLLPPGNPPRFDIQPWVDTIPKEFQWPSLCPQYILTPAILGDWIDPALRLPPVLSIMESDSVIKKLKKQYRTYEKKWLNTKERLTENCYSHGLNFKPWRKNGKTVKDVFSVRVDQGFRAHLRNLGQGSWEAFEIGTHTQLGHD